MKTFIRSMLLLALTLFGGQALSGQGVADQFRDTLGTGYTNSHEDLQQGENQAQQEPEIRTRLSKQRTGVERYQMQSGPTRKQ
jgi:hypothetical protein